jgi:hypothetical protein
MFNASAGVLGGLKKEACSVRIGGLKKRKERKMHAVVCIDMHSTTWINQECVLHGC